jgi:hypothetical protein
VRSSEFSIDLIPPVALLDSPTKRFEYQKSSCEQRTVDLRLKLNTSPPSLSELYRNFASLDVSQPYRPPQTVIGITLHFSIFFSLGWGAAEPTAYEGYSLANVYHPRVKDDECGAVSAMIAGKTEVMGENML